ncbi:MAG: hypothetical protein JXR76_23630 [Deltaproteobacteria bacterium]|nr:hypothetical protein [Deltaproteobacteria bacterium]
MLSTFCRLSLLAAFCIFLATVVAIPGYGQTAPAETSMSDAEKAEALSHFQKGQARFDSGEYLLAVEHFKKAYDITRSPEILYNIAMCYEAQQENEQAVAYYNQYLQTSSGDDAADVKKKIKALGGAVGSSSTAVADTNGDGKNGQMDEDDGDGAKTDDRKRIDHFDLELDMGPGFVLLTPDTGIDVAGGDPEKRNYFSIDVLAHFFLNDWFAITGGVLIGAYIEGDERYVSKDPKSHLGLAIGVGMTKKVQERVSLFTNLLAAPSAIWRKSVSRRAAWFAFDVRFGAKIRLTDKWQLDLMAVAEGGPAMVIKPNSTEDWDTGLLVSVGPRLGITWSAQ